MPQGGAQSPYLHRDEVNYSGMGEIQDDRSAIMASGGLGGLPNVCHQHISFLSGSAPIAFASIDVPTSSMAVAGHGQPLGATTALRSLANVSLDLQGTQLWCAAMSLGKGEAVCRQWETYTQGFFPVHLKD